MFGKYAAFIVPSYLISAIVIVGLTGWIMFQYRQRKAEIRDLEARGIRRASSKQG